MWLAGKQTANFTMPHDEHSPCREHRDCGNAINREEGLREAVLDEATFAQLLIDIQMKKFEVNTDWLEITLPIFSFNQIGRLYQDTGLIGKLAEKAGITTKGKA